MSKKRAKAEREKLRELGLLPEKGKPKELFLVPTGQTFLALAADTEKLETFPVLQAFSPSRRAAKALRAGKDPVEAARPKMPDRSRFDRMFGPKRTVAAAPRPSEDAIPKIITQSADSTPSPVEVATEAATTEGAE